MKFVDTPTLRVAYEDYAPSPQSHAPQAGSEPSRTVFLLHGWPDSPRCWQGLVPGLTQAGWRVIVPWLRGYGQTRFHDPKKMRSGQLAAFGRDLIELIDALQLNTAATKPMLVGHDWGARAVANACGLRPGIASHLVMMSVGYGTNNPDQVINMVQAKNYWYHWFMATPRGAKAVREERRALSKLMWESWAPPGWYSDAEFEATAGDWDNPDWADIVVSSYTQRWGNGPSDPAYAKDEAALNPAPVLNVPTLIIHGEADGVNPPSSSAGKEAFFQGRYERILLPGVGHFPQREASGKVLEALLQFAK